ncbi:MAG: Alkaline phosphatase synthesis transcriptional regulatory protein PhoP [bacterium ADurb.Bin212]|nr:MAG: Alkaline phosphatase synthesis transcriptional regulatory protein PhoP [bacterium ADurb.Bin212]
MSKILIIDDEEPILNMYGEALGGHEVMFANNGEVGLDMALKQDPDLILLDIIMPKFNGLDVLDKLKSDKDTASIPVMILSNLPKEASADKARELGAAGYFVKAEFEPDKLATTVNRLLREGEIDPSY